MGDVTKKTVKDTVDTATEYSFKLKDLIKSITEAEQQVESSGSKTLTTIDTTFDLLTNSLVESLNQRRILLKAEARSILDEGLTPLKECRDVINDKLNETTRFINEGKNILKTGGITSQGEAIRFNEHASLLGSLPAVPNLDEVPSISFQCNPDIFLSELQFNVKTVGRVSRMGPVQISCVEEKPGALLVHWEEVDLERMVDIGSFRLQMMHGDALDLIDSNAHDVYAGPESQYLVRDLRPFQAYTFRVCCRAEGEIAWSAWSLAKVAATHQRPFAWEESNPNYAVTNDAKLATKATSESSTLFSTCAQFGAGHSIEFTVLECGGRCSNEGLALMYDRTDGENLVRPGVFFLSATGCVYVDGSEKTTKLPPLEKGSKVCFTCEHIRDYKIRVNIDSCNKSVTYDWNTPKSSHHKLYFAIRFGENAWKVLVE